MRHQIALGAGLSLGGVSLPRLKCLYITSIRALEQRPTVTGPPKIVSGEKKGS